MTSQTPVDDLITALLAARPPMDDDDRALAVALYRRLALGHPVTEAELAADISQPVDGVHARLDSWPGVFRDDGSDVIGFWGLTILDIPPHRYRVHDAQLWTWCAWDTLFITPILGATADVDSRDAETTERVTLTVTPGGVTDTSHPTLVMSFLNPTGRFDADVIQNFCHYVHFFADPKSGERWTSRHPGTLLLDLDGAVTLGARFAQALLAGTR